MVDVEYLQSQLNDYCDELEVLRNLSKITIKNYKQTNDYFIRYLKENNIDIEHKPDVVLKKFIIYLKKDKDNGYSTINKYLQQVIQFLKYLNIKVDIQLPKDNSKNKKIKYLRPEEVNEVLKTIPNELIRDKAIVQTLYRTGLRVSELCNLKKQDLNMNSVEKAIAVYVYEGKGGKDRTVYIDDKTLKLINIMIYKRTIKNNSYNESEYLFTNKNGSRLSERSVQKIVKKYAIATDRRLAMEGRQTNFEERLTPHTLRHSFTIFLLNYSNRPINEVQQLLGHSNISTTQIYSKVDDKRIKQSYENIDW
ncbi:MAG: tyrosine-type recombinase/integrase [Methanobrevibacter sp.]|jgi:site-specific recombinase XerD|nr:tyrosine-type recombinase/integrase [Candidatus Methanovirga aequatorialis]